MYSFDYVIFYIVAEKVLHMFTKHCVFRKKNVILSLYLTVLKVNLIVLT